MQISEDLAAPILVTGAGGLVGSALCDLLRHTGHSRVIGITSDQVDLRDRNSTIRLIEQARPTFIYHCAARVYGIRGNLDNKGVSFFDNVTINTNVVEAARIAKVRKIVAMGSGCVYPYPPPRLPLHENMVWLGPPHPSEDSYAHAKRAMLAQLDAYKEQYGLAFAFVISGNLYGPRDKFDAQNGHVIPSLISKFYHAQVTGSSVTIWGDGSAKRDFLFVDDAARALVAIMSNGSGPINMGSGQVHCIRDIVDILSRLTGTQDRVVWDQSQPNGQEYRAYDLSRLSATGFAPQISLDEGLARTYAWYHRHKTPC